MEFLGMFFARERALLYHGGMKVHKSYLRGLWPWLWGGASESKRLEFKTLLKLFCGVSCPASKKRTCALQQTTDVQC